MWWMPSSLIASPRKDWLRVQPYQPWPPRRAAAGPADVDDREADLALVFLGVEHLAVEGDGGVGIEEQPRSLGLDDLVLELGLGHHFHLERRPRSVHGPAAVRDADTRGLGSLLERVCNRLGGVCGNG